MRNHGEKRGQMFTINFSLWVAQGTPMQYFIRKIFVPFETAKPSPGIFIFHATPYFSTYICLQIFRCDLVSMTISLADFWLKAAWQTVGSCVPTSLLLLLLQKASLACTAHFYAVPEPHCALAEVVNQKQPAVSLSLARQHSHTPALLCCGCLSMALPVPMALAVPMAPPALALEWLSPSGTGQREHGNGKSKAIPPPPLPVTCRNTSALFAFFFYQNPNFFFPDPRSDAKRAQKQLTAKPVNRYRRMGSLQTRSRRVQLLEEAAPSLSGWIWSEDLTLGLILPFVFMFL